MILDIEYFKHALLLTVIKGLSVKLEEIENFHSYNKYVQIKLKDGREFKIYPEIR